jgi:hypothetical protein
MKSHRISNKKTTVGITKRNKIKSDIQASLAKHKLLWDVSHFFTWKTHIDEGYTILVTFFERRRRKKQLAYDKF